MAEFQVLGPVEIRAGGRLVDAGQPRQRAVLAALLVDAGRPVTVDVLVDRVWGGAAPKEVRQALYSYVARLRSALAAVSPAAPLVRRSGGYLLDVDRERVDLHRFTGLVRRARDPAGSARDRVALLREALGQWHGEPLAGLSGEWAERMRGAWREQYLDAAVAWAAAELAAGDPRATIGPLTDLATAHPLAESLVAALMRALHRTGRGADALDRYTETRLRLADELGTDPGAELQDVHRAILRGDPSPSPGPSSSAPSSPEPSSSVPAQLPLDGYGFVGRDEEIGILDAILDKTTDQPTAVLISALSGTAGVGKTALAVHWAHRVCAEFPDGQLYVNLRGFDPGGAAMDPAEAVRGFLDALDVPSRRIPSGLDAQAALYRSLLADRRMVVLLDNARDAAQVRPLLPGSRSVLVLVTSRNPLASLVAVEGARPLHLDLLSVAEAYLLLARRIGHDRVAAEPDAVDEIVARCSRLPLALAIVAARAASYPHLSLAALAADLRDSRGGLDALTGEDAVTDLRAVFSWSYRQLGTPAARLFRLLGLHPGPDIGVAAAASLAGLPGDLVRRCLVELVRANLVTEHLPGRYRCHDLLRAYAAELAGDIDTGTDRRAATGRVLDHYLHTAHAAALLVNPHRDRADTGPAGPGVVAESIADHDGALAWFATERAVLSAAIDFAANAGLDSYVWGLAWTLADFLDRRGDWHDQLAIQRAALAAARRQAEPGPQAHARLTLGRAAARLNLLDDAAVHYAAALELSGELGNHVGQAHAHLNLCLVFGRQGRDRDALDHAERGLEMYRKAGRRSGEASALNVVGWYHAMLGDYERAARFCAQSLAVQRAVGNEAGQAAALDSLGYAHHHLGDHAAAIACYRRAVELDRKLGDRFNEAETLVHLGEAHLAVGAPDLAADALRGALVIFEELGHPDAGEVRAKLVRLEQPPPPRQ